MARNVTSCDRGTPSSPSTRTLAERYEHGVGLRRKTPREKHADLLGTANRDPVTNSSRR